MNRIDTNSWNEFKLIDLFDIILPIGDIQAQKIEDGNIPLVSSGKNNNGICKYIINTTQSNILPSNSITVDMFGKAFFHDYEYYCVSHGRVNVLIPKFDINQYIGLYIAKVIENVTISKYEFLDMCSQSMLKKEKIKLPIKENGQTDFEYMENYMKSIFKKSKQNIENLSKVNGNKKVIDTKKWKQFEVGKLFKIIKPQVLHSREVIESEDGIPYVVRTKFDNGIKYKVIKKEFMKPSPKGTISFGAENANFFYQEQEYVSGRDIYYIDTSLLSKHTCLFLLTVLQTISSKYSYNYGMFPELVKKEIIKLPIKKDETPDWEYMENYMKNIMEELKIKLDALKTINI